MDSVTQFALGATIGAAVLGKRMGPWKAAVTGGLLGTLPDMDVLYPFDDPIDSFTLHRGPSHSFFIQALVTPLFGEALVRLFETLKNQRLRTYLAVYLIFVTHALIDALTVYGTRVFWPILPDPVGTGSIFIIDPLYTLPLLIVMVWAFCLRSWSSGFGRALTGALIFSTAYLGWGLAAQQVVQARAATLLSQAGIYPERLLGSPTPFNTLLWKVIAVDGQGNEGRYINLYIPLLGGQDSITAYVHPRGTEGLGRLGCLEALAGSGEASEGGEASQGGAVALAKLAEFSDGFYRIEESGGEIHVADLRMGMTPNYVFRFAIARETPAGLAPTAPERRPSERSAEGDLDWLQANLTGTPMVRTAEAAALADLSGPVMVAEAESVAAGC
ncbi:metal-dependent hydrolase [Pelagibius litoralis]|uniref:Metal-dependent hydrolase n=1 Tax=Pelagibius litoralis TaxID=374515 RepID=A0A967EZ52_9PROT|nr:metal-dependent hydrolase [Pelagibius litoralis]NIA70088.1 metal-dependent hydrolase [Pelagibius litoralis]